MTKKLILEKSNIYSTLVFISCVEIPSLTRQHGQNYLFLARFFILLFLFLRFMSGKKVVKTHFFKNIISIITLWFFYLLFMTYLNGKDLIYALRIISIPYVMALYIYQYRGKIIKILHCWCFWLFVIVAIDFLTMILYPQGMYNDGLYSLNWFLGYKTARFQIELPLCVISAYLSKLERGKISGKSYIYLLMSMFCSLVAKTTSAFVCLVFLFILFAFLNIGEKFKHGKKQLYRVFNYRNIICIYFVAVICLIGISSMPVVQKIVEIVFHKDATLTTRTYIWEMMLAKILQKPICGYGILNQETYISITNSPYANSAHNMVLALMMEGGIVGTFLYFVILKKALNRKYTISIDEELILIAGIIVGLILGLTSVSLLYCEFSMVMYEILCLNHNFSIGGLNEKKYL